MTHGLFDVDSEDGNFDIAVVKIRGVIDFLERENAVLPICPRDMHYPEGIAMGIKEFMSHPGL